jgi:hypothetical protein
MPTLALGRCFSCGAPTADADAIGTRCMFCGAGTFVAAPTGKQIATLPPDLTPPGGQPSGTIGRDTPGAKL